jgi:hypothetical protein
MVLHVYTSMGSLKSTIHNNVSVTYRKCATNDCFKYYEIFYSYSFIIKTLIFIIFNLKNGYILQGLYTFLSSKIILMQLSLTFKCKKLYFTWNSALQQYGSLAHNEPYYLCWCVCTESPWNFPMYLVPAIEEKSPFSDMKENNQMANTNG